MAEFIAGAGLGDRVSTTVPNIEERLDADFYQPKFLRLEKRLEELSTQTIESLSAIVRTGPFGSTLPKNTYEDDGVVVLRPFNIKDATTEEANLVFISEKDRKSLGLNLYEPGDVVFARVGDIRCGVIADYGKPITISPNIIVARLKTGTVDPYFLSIFMNTAPGLLQMERGLKVVAQPTITVETIKSVQVPNVSEELQSSVSKVFRDALEKQKESQQLYQQAEEMLLTALGLDSLDLSPQLAYTGTFGEMNSAGRFDSEYFQPQYEDLFRTIRRTEQVVRLGDWVQSKIRRGKQPEYAENGEIPVINSKHVGKKEIELGDNRSTLRKFANLPSNRHGIVRQFDVLLNSTGMITIGRCQVMLVDAMAYADGHVSIIRPKKGIDPVYLSLYLNSLPGQLQTERGWTGSSGQIELRPEIVSDYLIWKAPEEIQQSIRHLVLQSHTKREEAKQLLETAKQRVEAMILGNTLESANEQTNEQAQ